LKFYKFFLKPIIDRIAALILLIILSPIIILLILVLGVLNNGSVFFTQSRPGYKTKIFKVIKFKTMNDSIDSYGNLLPDHDRLTRIGRFLRLTSLDELLQLVNVLKGDMSFVGPRPLLIKYLDRYTKEQIKRHNVKPGITGWAQINGRNSISWNDKFKLDLYYVKHQSFILDLKILLKTFFKVIMRKDINSNSKTSMDEFKG
tara:strand:+ start:8451 stop:9056 length:606 start_codon:yes stop_codon:yes gene_type:complete